MRKKKLSGLIKTKKKIIGIDYSLNSPAVCITDDSFEFEKSNFFFLTSKKKHMGIFGKNIYGTEHKEYKNPIERFYNISQWVLNIIDEYVGLYNLEVYIEGYSFGSKGQAIFQIAENCGILKYRLMDRKIDYETIVPTQIKKFASGKGNADKQLMYDSFCKEHKNDLMKDFDMGKLNNPVTDIVDSFYIAKYGFDKNKKSN